MLILDDMALFVAVARAGSFTQAAQSLEMPKSTLSARISRLERAWAYRCSSAARARWS